MYLFVDVETGGLDPQRHSLLTLGVVLADDQFNEIKTHSFLFSCDEYHVTAEALNVNGIDVTALRMLGVDYSAAQAVFNSNSKAIIAGWNVAFDVSFIKHWINPVKMSYRMLDVQSIFRFMYPMERGSLKDAAIKLEMQDMPDHSALLDARVTLQIARKIKSLVALPV